jgi:hypothetical protein
MAEDNLQYYERRAREEREAETAATSSEAASAHRLLALEYEAQARELRCQTEGAAKYRGNPVQEGGAKRKGCQ